MKVNQVITRIGKWDFSKLKGFCAGKETITSMKRKTIEL
jgi:hypothetical protein